MNLDEFCRLVAPDADCLNSDGYEQVGDVMVEYFVVLFVADFLAAAQAETDVDGMCDAA